MKIFNSRQHHDQNRKNTVIEKTVIEKIYGSIHHIVSMWKPTSVEYFKDSLTSNSRDNVNTASYLIEFNLRITYNCMPNMASIIRNHNTSLLKDPTPTDIKECSCHQKTECPLDKNCLSGCLVYNALVDRLDTNKTKHYYWICEKRALWQPHSIF